MTQVTATDFQLSFISAETLMQEALTHLSKLLPGEHVAIQFQLEYDDRSGFTLPAYVAKQLSDYDWVEGMGSNPITAVKELMRLRGITRVEQYIRLKRNQA